MEGKAELAVGAGRREEGKERERSGSTGSMGNIEELLWKRKRKEMDKSREGNEDIFKRSRKTVRSPNKEKKRDENEMKRLRKKMEKGIYDIKESE